MNISTLPEVSDIKAISYDYFPTPWQAVVWRNWGYVPVERIAEALGTSCDKIREAAGLLGLNPEEPVSEDWEKRGFLTLIRNNWHLCTYEQIMTLLKLSEEALAFILKEDDFMWIKLGGMKPAVEPPQYAPLTEEQRVRTGEIAELFRVRFPAGQGVRDNAFAFVKEYQRPLGERELAAGEEPAESGKVTPEPDALGSEKMASAVGTPEATGLRMIYPYFALYGDSLIDESIDPFPERLLRDYARVGVNGIWMQGVLYQLVEFPFDPSMSKGWEKRISSLRKLVAKAKKFGISVYLYLNEPRAMSDAFFQKYPQLRGEQEGDFYAMCTSTLGVQDYLYQGMKRLFTLVPDLAGFFTITMSENLTNCYSRLAGEMTCPRCKKRNPWEVIAEVNNLMARGAHEANPNAKAITWAWGWTDDWAQKVVPLLTEGQILQCTSEEAMKFQIGGVEGSVLDYTMSLCGPGEKAKWMWKAAGECGLEMSAKVQINNTWEMAAVPYIPVFDKVAEHISNLKEQGIRHLQVSWTLGGCPGPNLKLAAWLMEDKGNLRDFLVDWLGEETAAGVYAAQQRLSQAFSHYPFYIGTLYYGPQNYGPMAPFFLEKTGYRASMIGYPYDDMEWWSGIYPADVYENEYRQLCDGWREGLELLALYEGRDKELDEVIFMARAILCQYESAYHHIQFVNRRKQYLEKQSTDLKKQDDDSAKEEVALCCQELLRIIHEEMETVQHMIRLRLADSRVGFESSNHYFYTLQDLREKMINLAFCEARLIHRQSA